MAWYIDVGDNCCYADHEVKAWRWWKNGIIAFDKWAKEHNIHYEHKQDGDFGEGSFAQRLKLLKHSSFHSHSL